MTPLGLGLAAVGRPAYLNLGHADDLGDHSVEALRARCFDLLDAAYELAIRYVDVARSYGRAEEFLADWLAARGHGDVMIGSKWGYTYVGDWRVDAGVHEVKDHSLEAFERQRGETLALLNGHLDLYQIHSATPETGVLRDPAVLAALLRLRDQGVQVGVTVSGPRQAVAIREALSAEIDGVNPFSSVQATWNALESSAGPALAEASEAGWTVIVKEALANGRLTARSDDPALRERLGALAGRVGATPDALAIAYVLAQPWITTVLSGAATPAQLRSNAAAPTLRLDGEVLDELARWAEPAEEYWTRRSALPWT